jgi:hypothetical protein
MSIFGTRACSCDTNFLRITERLEADRRLQEEVTRSTLAQLTSLDREVAAVKTSVEVARVASDTHLSSHVSQANPHPVMEEWVRKHLVSLGEEVNKITTALASWRGSLRVAIPLLAITTGVLTSVISRAIGG